MLNECEITHEKEQGGPNIFGNAKASMTWINEEGDNYHGQVESRLMVEDDSSNM